MIHEACDGDMTSGVKLRCENTEVPGSVKYGRKSGRLQASRISSETHEAAKSSERLSMGFHKNISQPVPTVQM